MEEGVKLPKKGMSRTKEQAQEEGHHYLLFP